LKRGFWQLAYSWCCAAPSLRGAMMCVALASVGVGSPATAFKKTEDANKQLWEEAQRAYRLRQYDTGHQVLKELMESNPGDAKLASRCLERILHESARQVGPSYFRPWNARINRSVGRHKVMTGYGNDRWAQYSAQRMCVLQRTNQLHTNPSTMQRAVDLTLYDKLRHGRAYEAVELINRFVAQYPQDPIWRILQASVYRRVRSAEARPLYESLIAEMDLSHPDSHIRRRWLDFSDDLPGERRNLPRTIAPLPEGSPLQLTDQDDPEDLWTVVGTNPAGKIPQEVDRLAARAVLTDELLIWNDDSGLIDPVRALDLHLLGQSQEQLQAVRTAQTARLAREEDVPLLTTEAETLHLSRRYAWASLAQQRLLTLANRQLWSGHAQSALRSFSDVLGHTLEPRLRDAAQVGYWTALSQTGEVTELAELLGHVKPDRVYTWLGKPITVEALCKQLLATRSMPRSPVAVLLKDLTQQAVHIPPMSPWIGGPPSAVDLVASDQELLVSGRNMLARFNAQAASEPTWVQYQGQENPHHRNVQPGYFRPLLAGSVLYSRSGFGKEPGGITALDRATGGPLWSNEGRAVGAHNHPPARIPLGDPVLSDGMLYYLQWSTRDNNDQPHSRRLSLVCFDPYRRRNIWGSTIAMANSSSDFTQSLARANAALAVYGNRVTIRRGAIYSNTNCGMIVRSDVRDGRTEWIHHYPRGGGHRNMGAAPVVVNDVVVCLPRDAGRLFALDQRTGRLLWENSFVQATQFVGTVDGLLIIRSSATIAALNIETGKIHWYNPLSTPALGRIQMIGSSIYVAQSDALRRFDARGGFLEETRPWQLGDERPLATTVHGKHLYVVTNRPTSGPSREIDRPLSSPLPPDGPPLAQAWSLPRTNARVAMPPSDSPLKGTAYVISDGILECIDLSATGKILWHRFVDTHNASLHFAGEKLLVLDQVGGRIPGVATHVMAIHARSGRFLWEQHFVDHVNETIPCGDSQLFHSSNRFVAAELSTGRVIWRRQLGGAHRIKIQRDGDHLHIVFVAPFNRGCEASHIKIDIHNGRTLLDMPITYKVPDGVAVGVGRVQIDDIVFGDKMIYLKSHGRWNPNIHVFRYTKDGQPAILSTVLKGNVPFSYAKPPYFITNTKVEKQHQLIVHRFDDPNYQFPIGPSNRIDARGISITGDRLIADRRAVVVADLAKRRFIVGPIDPKQPHRENGVVLRGEANHIWKIIEGRRENPAFVRYHLTTGATKLFPLPDPTTTIQIRDRRGRYSAISHVQGLFLLSNNTTLTAWSVRN